jgi:hypothetical protein
MPGVSVRTIRFGEISPRRRATCGTRRPGPIIPLSVKASSAGPDRTQELLGGRDAIAEWSKPSYGFMGRTPDDKAASMASLGGDTSWWDPFADNARACYRKYASKGHERRNSRSTKSSHHT